MLVFKGKEELENMTTQAKQRHHVLSQYIVGAEGMVNPSKLGITDHGESEFLKKFYISNSA
jgi:NADH dehydrogenase (ubiquinone) 1 alpha subcomplex subunit 6